MKMRLILPIIISLIVSSCTYTTTNQQILICDTDLDSLQKIIVDYFDADSVSIYTKRVKEESYFPEMRSPIILIYNPTTKILDFKSLPIDHYQRIDNTIAIEDSLTMEGETIAKILLRHCDLSEFNDLIIEFIKQDKLGGSQYRFICHYRDLLMQQN